MTASQAHLAMRIAFGFRFPMRALQLLRVKGAKTPEEALAAVVRLYGRHALN